MLLEKLFGNTFGLIVLVLFMAFFLGLIVFFLVKKEKEMEEFVSDEEISEISVEENVDGDVGIIEEITVEEEKQPNEEVAVVSEYEILESDDGFFRVRKVGSERTLRKLETKEEALEFIKQKETK